MDCLTPPLECVPIDEWYCIECTPTEVSPPATTTRTTASTNRRQNTRTNRRAQRRDRNNDDSEDERADLVNSLMSSVFGAINRPGGRGRGMQTWLFSPLNSLNFTYLELFYICVNNIYCICLVVQKPRKPEEIRSSTAKKNNKILFINSKFVVRGGSLVICAKKGGTFEDFFSLRKTDNV